MTLGMIPVPAKALTTCVIVTLAIAMFGALGQIVVHDIIPTFFSPEASGKSLHDMGSQREGMGEPADPPSSEGRGDLFSDLTVKADPPAEPFYKGEQFVWLLKWTHIHLFGMNMIFIFLGVITFMLDIGSRFRTWLIVVPFIGVLIDILAMWLKGYVSPVFFWLHIPGGGAFGLVFVYVSLRALREMWFTSVPPESI
ncbi:hypothetical protein D3OALGA1CA_3792 [Olavius algarvensis associated proteobacterium Delta 3]|nr:hypothetical protein D3OALGA1CA_3792 [Olavius algarvensis associated proteobacterium Delta 3]CAB5150083.1 hypothetical protein D3OALGB2SA_4750 [Olavius algarvensis associated proteobacterium Delta 3]